MDSFKPSKQVATGGFSPSKNAGTGGFSPSKVTPSRGFSGASASVRNNKVSDYAPGIQGFKSQSDAAAFAMKFGALDTVNGVIQMVPGKVGEANMARDQKRFEYAYKQYGNSILAAYGAGLIADPAGWMIPVSKLRIPGRLAGQAVKLSMQAKDYAQVGAAGAVVGAVGYTPGDVGSEEWLKMKGIQTGLGAVAAPAMLGVGKGVANQWLGGKGKRWGQNESPLVGPQPKNYNPKTDPLAKPKTLGEAGWGKFSNSPAAVGTAVGGSMAGFGGYHSGMFEDFGDKTLRDMFGDEEPRDWQKWVNGTLGTILGGAGMRRAFVKNPKFFMPKYGKTKTQISAKQARRGEEGFIMEAHILPVAAKLEKLSMSDRKLLFEMVTQEVSDGADAARIAKLDPLKDEINTVVHQLGRTLVDQGILSEKIWLKNKDKYLHRLYRRPEKFKQMASTGGYGLIADEIRSRGEKRTIQISDWMRGKYDAGGSRNKGKVAKDGAPAVEPYKWEAWENTSKGRGEGWKEWKEERRAFIADNQSELNDLYRRSYGKEMFGRAEARVKSRYPNASDADVNLWLMNSHPDKPGQVKSRTLERLTDKERANIRQTVKDDFLPENLRSKNQPAATMTIRRDWTKAERVEMGEVDDILDTFLATGRLLAYDGATATMLRTLRLHDSSAESNPLMKHTIHIPHTAENQKKYGALSGRFISEDLEYDLKHFNGDEGIAKLAGKKLFREYRKFNSFWKGTKTIANPAVHFGNFVSNIQHYDHAMAGMGMGKWKILGEAMREMPLGSGKTRLVPGSDLNEAVRRGLLDATLVTGELREEGIHAIRRILAREATALEKLTNSDVALVKFASRVTRKIWDESGGKLVSGMSKAYQWEDNVFRYALFKAEKKRYMDMGLSREAAYDAATRKGREWFVDYADVPPALGWLRETALPFASYTYGIVPRLVETAMKHPMKVAKWAAIGHIANEAGWTASDDSDRKEIERLQEAQSVGYDSMWGLPGTSPTKIKIADHFDPFHNKGDAKGFWDIARIYAGGNLFDSKEGGVGQVKILPGFAQPGFGIAGAVGYTVMSIDQYKGKDIPEGEKIAAFYKQIVPNLVFIPETYANVKLRRAMSGVGDDNTVDMHTAMTAIASSLGIKINPAIKDKLEYRVASKFQTKLGDLKTKARNAARDFEKGDYHSIVRKVVGQDPERIKKAAEKKMEKEIESIVREMERLAKSYKSELSGN